MPTVSLTRYALDPTGTSPNNYVSGEPKVLSVGAIRAVAPTYGPFFTESFQIYDDQTGRRLDRGIDFKFVELLQDATMKFSKEICQVVLIISPAVSSNVRMNYQLLGGLYQNDNSAIVNMYNAIMNDTRGVDWSNVLNKQLDYPPSFHRHLLEDVYGFQPLVSALERVRNAIVLSDVPAFEAVIEYVNNVASSGVFTDPVVTTVNAGQAVTFNVSTSNKRNGQRYFWNLKGINTSYFASFAGDFTLFQNRGSFILRMASAPETTMLFDVEIRVDRADGPIVTTIEGIAYIGVPVVDPGGDGELSDIALLSTCCIMNPGVPINAKSLYIKGDE